MTSPRIALAALAVALAICADARADIYSWTDPNGNLNVSNVPPPEGVRVTKVIRASTSPSAAHDPNADGARVQALSERVQQLEEALQAAARPALSPPPPPVVQPVVQYVPVPVPAAVEYVAPQPAAPTCDPGWGGCWSWGWPFYPSSVVVTTAPAGRHYRNPDRRHPAPHAPAMPYGSIKGVSPFGIVRPLVR